MRPSEAKPARRMASTDQEDTGNVLTTEVTRLMRCDAGPAYLRESDVRTGQLTSYDAEKRGGRVQLEPGVFASFSSAELFRRAGRCVALEVGELLEFELEEADSIGLLAAVRVTAQGGAPV